MARQETLADRGPGYAKPGAAEKRLVGSMTKAEKLERVKHHQEHRGLVIRQARPGELPPPRNRPRKPSAAKISSWAKDASKIPPGMPGR